MSDDCCLVMVAHPQQSLVTRGATALPAVVFAPGNSRRREFPRKSSENFSREKPFPGNSRKIPEKFFLNNK